jgi:hypothetical protein
MSTLPTTNLTSTKIGSKWSTLGILLVLTALSILFWDNPTAYFFLAPIRIFVTAVHELSHAIVCIATGGSVSGMTIVSDGHGHGGLTFCHGGLPFFYAQAGYLGSAVFGCILIFLSQSPQLARGILMFLGCMIGIASLWFMPGTILAGAVLEGVGSITWGLALAAALVWCALKLPLPAAHTLIIFLAVQTGLNALTDVWYLVQLSSGLSAGAGWSDATNMQEMTGVPALIWSGFWAVSAVCMLGGTLWACYGAKPKSKLLSGK